MKQCYGYVRVSTAKQGDGVSLQEQRAAIEAFAARNDLTIIEWFEEKQTAAKGGRPTFNRMLKNLKTGRAQGLIIHKIDRSARNLRDWAAIGELSDAGIDVFFATETLDFRSRGGRLTADIQAVIAADYIRNLREECKKGIRGRLKQGLYPFKAPVGYLDNGGGKPKTPDPKTAPIVRELFELYATGQHTYESLIEVATARGLRNVKGGKITLHGIETMLGNPFYAGLIRIRCTGETYPAVHEPLIPMSLFERVETIRTGRRGPIKTRHRHLYRRLFTCGLCSKTMIPELQKGRVYYRCKRQGCPTTTLREDVIDGAVRAALAHLKMTTEAEAKTEDHAQDHSSLKDLADRRAAIELKIVEESDRLVRLTDLLIDGTLDKDAYADRKSNGERRLLGLRQALAALPTPEAIAAESTHLAELQKNLCRLHETTKPEEKRELVEILWPNRTIVRKNVELEPCEWLEEALATKRLPIGDPHRGHDRTLANLMRIMARVAGGQGDDL